MGRNAEEFAFLGEEKACEVVVTNSNWVKEQLEEITPVKDELFNSKIEGAMMKSLNGVTIKHMNGMEILKKCVEDRIKKELKVLLGMVFR